MSSSQSETTVAELLEDDDAILCAAISHIMGSEPDNGRRAADRLRRAIGAAAARHEFREANK
jgi:hypothetical protein